MIVPNILDRLFRREIIGLRGADPYMIRWVIYRRPNRGAGAYIHLFIGDDAADSHDHPKEFLSIGLKGSYDEEVWDPEHKWVHHKAPWIRRFGPMHRHRIVLCGEFVWTLVFVGPQVRKWGFYTPEGWVQSDSYRPKADLHRDVGQTEGLREE